MGVSLSDLVQRFFSRSACAKGPKKLFHRCPNQLSAALVTCTLVVRMRVVRIIMGESEMHSIRCRKSSQQSCLLVGNRTNVTLAVRSSAGNP